MQMDTICNEFITLMGEMVLDTIVSEVKAAKYYSVSTDSTPDACKVDRVTCILRYIPVNQREPVERFLQFLGTDSHTGDELTDTLLQFLERKGIDIRNCRGQSYDNASNMAGMHQRVQARAKELNPHTEYIPCFGHSLNLIGNDAANCVASATAFFDFLQNLYTFFGAFTYRWAILKSYISDKPVVKSLSQTRWSTRADAKRGKTHYVQHG